MEPLVLPAAGTALVVVDAMASRTAGEHAHTLTRIFPRSGRVRSTEQALAALQARR